MAGNRNSYGKFSNTTDEEQTSEPKKRIPVMTQTYMVW